MKGYGVRSNYSGSVVTPPVTAFSDTLQTQDPANPNSGKLSGKDWIFGITQPPSTTSVSTPGYSIGASVKDGANALLWNVATLGSPGTQAHGFLLPSAVFRNLYGKSQFSQCTMVGTSSAGGDIAAGLIVLCNPSNSQMYGYTFRVLSTDHTWQFLRYGVNDAVLSSGSAVADGDIFRLSADLSVNGQVTVTVLKNTVQLAQTIDTTNRLLLGSPGLACSDNLSTGTANTSEWRTFSCGLGL